MSSANGIFAAIRQGDQGGVEMSKQPLEVIKELLQSGIDINSKDEFGSTPLHKAVELRQKIEVITFLLDEGADVNAKNKVGLTPLHVSCDSKNRSSNQDWAKMVDIAELLLNRGADVLARDVRGCSALHLAVLSPPRNVDMVDLLLSHHANVNARTFRGSCTPLHLALLHFDITLSVNVIILLCVFGADTNAKNESGQTPSLMTLELWKNGKFFFGSLKTIVGLFLEHGASVSEANEQGSTPLHIAVQLKYVPTVEALIAHQAEINVSDSSGNTPLHLAMRGRYSNFATIKRLLDHQADVNSTNNDGNTPLLMLVLSDREGNIARHEIRLLIARGADVSVTNKAGISPIHIAVARGDLRLTRLLLKHLTNRNVKDKDGNTLLHLAMLPSCLACVSAENGLLCLDQQRYVTVRDGVSDTVVHMTVGEGQENHRKAIKANQFRMIQLLLRDLETAAAINVNVTNNSGKSPLSVAVCTEYLDGARLLVDHGANIHRMDRFQYTPFLMACEMGNLEMIYTLIRLSPHHLRPLLRCRARFFLC